MSLTPAMKQYMYFKNKHPDCMLFFRMGDFYETFYEDAEKASEILEITLTSRGKGDSRAPLAGIPYHALEPYLTKLVKNNIKVAICEQVEDPKKAKGIVKRDVVRIVTPGTLIESTMLEEKSNNFIGSINQKDNIISFSFCDISTSEFFTFSAEEKDTENIFLQYHPREIILPLSLTVNKDLTELLKKHSICFNSYDDINFRIDNAKSKLLTQFKILSLESLGIENNLEISASGALLNYIQETQFNQLTHIKSLKKVHTDEFMLLDSSTLRNLEIIKNTKDFTAKGTLLSVIDKTSTSMGARLLKKWLVQPLLNKNKIQERLDSVEVLVKNSVSRSELISVLKSVNDLERLISRINYGSANARDLISLKNSIRQFPLLKEKIPKETELLKNLSDIYLIENIFDLIENAVIENPLVSVKEGGIIKTDYNEKLKELHGIRSDSKKIIIEIENKERNRTGIKTIKIKFNKVFGYFIEISKVQAVLAPKDYIRKQTLVNAERFITPELKSLEEKILNAQEQIQDLEYEIFHSVITEIKKYTKEILDTADKISVLDCIVAFAEISQKNNYSKPEITDKEDLKLKNGRNPVLEIFTDNFVPNSILLKDNEILIITGPNMSGKSNILRQTALIVLMAHTGCFVPAEKAVIPLTDRIFTRVGAHDDLTQGKSTFMIEMSETANILNNATHKSLIILDEIGRGTSTFDGVSIAWSIAEYIHNRIKAKTLFATHYHILNKLASELSCVNNYNIAVKEVDEDIIFLRKLIPGGTDKSYGIHVAKLAGVPEEVVRRAGEIQEAIESEDTIKENIKTKKIEINQEKLI